MVGASSYSSAHTCLRLDAHIETGTGIATVVPMSALAPELTADGLVLWRLRRGAERRLYCEVKDLAGELLIRVHDPATARTAVSEVHETIAAVVDRAEHLRRQYSAAGWQLVDVDVGEPESGSS